MPRSMMASISARIRPGRISLPESKAASLAQSSSEKIIPRGVITILLSCVLRTASRVSLILMGEQFIGLEPNLPGVTSL